MSLVKHITINRFLSTRKGRKVRRRGGGWRGRGKKDKGKKNEGGGSEKVDGGGQGDLSWLTGIFQDYNMVVALVAYKLAFDTKS